MTYEGRYLRLTVVPTGNASRDAQISQPGTLLDLKGRILRVDRSYSTVPYVTEDGQPIPAFIHLEQDMAANGVKR